MKHLWVVKKNAERKAEGSDFTVIGEDFAVEEDVFKVKIFKEV